MNRNVDGAFKPLYQLNHPKDYKTFGIEKIIFFHSFVFKNIKFCGFTYFNIFSV